MNIPKDCIIPPRLFQADYQVELHTKMIWDWNQVQRL